MVYACGIIAAFTCGWLMLSSTFGHRPELRENAVNLFGLRAPLGIFLAAWGGLAMLYSAPVDNWWHNAYGLDVRVASPPHILLLSGTSAIVLGTLLLAVAHLNRARLIHKNDEAYERLFLFVGSLAVIHLMSYSMGYTFDTRLHQAKAYFVMSSGVPFSLAALASATRRRWAATTITGIYTGFMLALVWGLPLIPASPRIGPVYQAVTHMVPPKFPILLLAPALALDLLWQFSPRLNRWFAAIVSGCVWLAVLVAVEWPFATFLMPSQADNRFFATRLLDFGTPANNADALRIFELPGHGLHLSGGLLAAGIVGIVGIHAGEIFGNWMRNIYR
jgi:hypothetical protein